MLQIHLYNGPGRQNYQHCPRRAVAAYYVKSGQVQQRESSTDEFFNSLPTDDEIRKFGESYEDAQNQDGPVCACAACGVVMDRKICNFISLSSTSFPKRM